MKDRLGGWQDSETRKSIYQDRETDVLRAQAASVRRQLRIGVGLAVGDATLANTPRPTDDDNESADALGEIEATWRSLTEGQRRALLKRLRTKDAS